MAGAALAITASACVSNSLPTNSSAAGTSARQTTRHQERVAAQSAGRRRSEAPVISIGFGKPMSSSTVGAISASRPSASDTLPPSISSNGTGFVV
jgi:hypothetical protein